MIKRGVALQRTRQTLRDCSLGSFLVLGLFEARPERQICGRRHRSFITFSEEAITFSEVTLLRLAG